MGEALRPGKENAYIQVWYLPMKHLCPLTGSTCLGISMTGIPVSTGKPGPRAAHLLHPQEHQDTPFLDAIASWEGTIWRQFYCCFLSSDRMDCPQLTWAQSLLS